MRLNRPGRRELTIVVFAGVLVLALLRLTMAVESPAALGPGVDPTARALQVTPVFQATPAQPTPGPSASVAPSVVPRAVGTVAPKAYLPFAARDGLIVPVPPPPAVAALPPTSVPAVVATSTPVATATPRPPMRLTKLGLGVYDSGGALLPALDEARPSVILLMDPAFDFAKDVRRRFPKAFVVGRIFRKDQPLDNPTARGAAFADLVAEKAVPLAGPIEGAAGGRPVVDAWMSYNEVANDSDLATLRAWNDFQVAFANRLQGHYKIPAVAGNDATNTISPASYGRYLAESARVSQYFGVHTYPPPDRKSLLEPAALDTAFSHRRIHEELAKAGVRKTGPYMIITELGLWDGWNGVTSDETMGRDFVCYADKLNADPYVIGTTIYGLFTPGRWDGFNVAGSAILRMMGDYNTEGFAGPRC